MEAEIHRQTAHRSDDLSNAMAFTLGNSNAFACKLLYRRYAGLVFSLVVDPGDNDLAMLESVHLLVEILDAQFAHVSELDIMFNFAKVMQVVDELYLGGELQETSKQVVLHRVKMMETLG